MTEQFDKMPSADAASQERLELELRDGRKLFQAIVDSEPECVKLITADGKIVMMNRAGLDMIEAESVDQLKPDTLFNLTAPVYREALSDLTRKVFQGGTGKLIFEMTSLGGHRLWLETHAAPLRNSREEIIALLAITRNITEQKKAEEILKQERDFSDALLNTVGAIVLVLDNAGKIVKFNRTCEVVSGYNAQEVLGKHVWDFLIPPEQVEAVKGVFENLVAGMFPSKYENYWVARDGTRKLIAWSNTALLAPDGSVEFVVPTGIDVTEQRGLGEQLRQAQKMESIGTLAGGMAHDFNNILTAITGYGSLLQMQLRQEDPLRQHVEQILSAADRASSLTRGLLAYSRKQILNARPVNLNEILKKVELLLSRLIDKDIELKTLMADTSLTVHADTGQIEQVLMNLATNARDAMPDGGCLFIETDQLVFDEEGAHMHGLEKPGAYAVLEVTDSGTGMDEKTRERIFDPFFTTKKVGKGTGLGLAIAYGIIKQHDGGISVHSEPGKGSSFTVYLPLVRDPVEQEPSTSTALQPITGGNETILVAEDEELVRTFTCQLLKQFGYQVIEAVDGEDAVNKFMENKEKVKLLLLDVIMPRKNGREVYSKISIFQPGIKALFLSGYAADIMHQKGLVDPGVNFLMKPVPVNELLGKIRSLLDGGCSR